MITYQNYKNNIDHCWYNSSNTLYSACYNNDTQFKTVKIVFKGGRTYVYRNVDVNDYILFRNAESNGEAFSKYIKKYQGVRVTDTDMEKLEEMRLSFIDGNKVIEESTSNLIYAMEVNNETGEFRLKCNGNTIYEGVENKVSIMNLFKAMHLAYSLSELKDDLSTEEDFINNELTDLNNEDKQ